MEEHIMENGKTEKYMVVEFIRGLMGDSTTASTTRTKSKATAFTDGQTVSNTRVDGWQVSSMAKAS